MKCNLKHLSQILETNQINITFHMQKFSAHVTTNKFVITNRQTTSGTSLPNDLGIFFKCRREQLIQ